MEMVKTLLAYLSSRIKSFDKYLHLLVGAVLYVGFHLRFDASIALAVVALAARWKELFDKANPDKHTYDGWDAYATMLGAVLGQFFVDSEMFLVLHAIIFRH